MTSVRAYLPHRVKIHHRGEGPLSGKIVQALHKMGMQCTSSNKFSWPGGKTFTSKAELIENASDETIEGIIDYFAGEESIDLIAAAAEHINQVNLEPLQVQWGHESGELRCATATCVDAVLTLC